MRRRGDEAVVVGAGPNGLAAAVTLAEAGVGVTLLEARDTVGGGARSAELTLPGFVHDVCSAVHPLAAASPFLRRQPLERHGLGFLHPPTPLVHPLDGGRAAVLERSLGDTAAALGHDAHAWRALFGPLVAGSDALVEGALAPLVPPRRPLALAGFAWSGLRSASGLARARFAGEEARALVAGLAAHSMLPLERPPTAAVGLLLGVLGHGVGWPVASGGSGRIAEALAERLRALGGEIRTGVRVGSLAALPPARAVLLDLTPRQLLELAGGRLRPGYRRALGRYRYGPGACKLDWALDGPVPWTAEAGARAGTLHLGGGLEEIAAAERAVAAGRHPERPFVLLAQQSVADPTRAPRGRHTLWAYCHVPSGSDRSMRAPVERQIERFAPGFRERVLACRETTARELEAYDENYVGGDINGGLQSLRQVVARPTPRLPPYTTPLRGVYLCSSATPPGGGVHGMCGHLAARSALRREWGLSPSA